MSTATFDMYGPWALVAGASEGIGASLARQLSAQGFKLVLIARREAVLQEFARSLPGETRLLPLDLSAHDTAQRIADATQDLDLGLVIYNAAYSPIGAFDEIRLEDNLRAIDLNVRTPTELAHRLLPRLKKRKHAALVLLSSLTAFQGSPFVSTYGATKSYLLSLAEGLWAETLNTGVDVLAVCAGATSTPGLLAAVKKAPPGMIGPDQVAEETLRALDGGPLLIPGGFNRFASFFMRRVMPRRTMIQIMGNQTKKLHA